MATAAREVAALLTEAQRPLILIGAGVRLSGAEARVRDLIEATGAPVLVTWPAQGVIGDDHTLYVGRPGLLAPRGANFALQNADFLLCLGARLDLVTTGYDPKDFGRNATKIVVDIDPAELAKLEGAISRGICGDVAAFVDALLPLVAQDQGALAPWQAQCIAWKNRYPLVTDEHRAPGRYISTYHLADALSELIADDDVLVPGSSGLGIEIFQLALRLHTGQRLISTTALGGMGYGPPTSIGACVGSGGRRTICVDGDGGLQLNVQELETIRRLQLPVKLFVLSNDGYASIRASQKRWFGRLVGADQSSGLTLPPLESIAQAYGIRYVALDGEQPLVDQLRLVLHSDGPVVCEVPSPPEEARVPVQISEATPSGGVRSLPLEDLAPRLTPEELAENMLAPVSRLL
jgi:acetolactate synthase-1/2/3 large subunit